MDRLGQLGSQDQWILSWIRKDQSTSEHPYKVVQASESRLTFANADT